MKVFLSSRPITARASPIDIALVLCLLGLIARLTVFLRRRSEGEYASIDTAAAAEIVIVGVTILVLIACSRRVWAAWRRIAGSSASLALMYYGCATVLALQSLHVAYSLFRAVEAASQFLALAALVAVAPSFRRAEAMVLKLAWAVLLLDVMGRFKLAGFTFGGMASNSYSATAAMLGVYCGSEWLEATGRRRLWLALSAIGALGLVVTGLSLASWWAALCGLLLAGFVLKPGRPALILVLILVLALALWGPDLVERVLMRNRSTEELATLHGRTAMWRHYWDAYLDRPWLGVGFAVGARLKGIVYTTHTHNAILAALLGCGVVGFAILVGMVGRFVREVCRSRRLGTRGWIGCTAALCCGLINSMTIAFLGESWMPASFVFTAFLLLHSAHVIHAATVPSAACKK